MPAPIISSKTGKHPLLQDRRLSSSNPRDASRVPRRRKKQCENDEIGTNNVDAAARGRSTGNHRRCRPSFNASTGQRLPSGYHRRFSFSLQAAPLLFLHTVETVVAVDNRKVNPSCPNASNPFHQCAEYCSQRSAIQKKQGSSGLGWLSVKRTTAITVDDQMVYRARYDRAATPWWTVAGEGRRAAVGEAAGRGGRTRPPLAGGAPRPRETWSGAAGHNPPPPPPRAAPRGHGRLPGAAVLARAAPGRDGRAQPPLRGRLPLTMHGRRPRRGAVGHGRPRAGGAPRPPEVAAGRGDGAWPADRGPPDAGDGDAGDGDAGDRSWWRIGWCLRMRVAIACAVIKLMIPPS
ncbi:hypothetical protein KSP39_PZI014985 [Platanthera zijinensis]|uniref:Uncharacterized protein n=1 Tax=Platanthera zijinensis TaxID=2320716 RepID=A0AAP0BAN9_9ASPA